MQGHTTDPTRRPGAPARALRLCVAVCALLCWTLASATSVAPKPLEELVAEADLVVVATIVEVDMLDGGGRQVTDPAARTGPGLENLMRLHLRVEEVLASEGAVPPSLIVPLWQMWHYELGDMRDDLTGVRGIFLLAGEDALPVYPAGFRRLEQDRDRILELLAGRRAAEAQAPMEAGRPARR